MVGLGEVLQHTPLSETEAPPADVTFPPLLAVEAVTAEAFAVVKVGATPAVLKMKSFPYTVPTLFVA
jgi:hypothetical protein